MENNIKTSNNYPTRNPTDKATTKQQTTSKNSYAFSMEKEILSKLSDLKNALVKKGKISEEEFPALKVLIRDVIGYKDLTPNARNEIINYISFVEKEKDEIIIGKEDSVIDMYVIVKGRIKISVYPPQEMHKELSEKDQFDLISQVNLFKTLKPGQIFGNYTCFATEKSWKSYYAYPESEGAEVIKLDFLKVKTLFDKLNEQQRHSEFLAFLSESIPGFKFRTTAHKERISKCFETKSFNLGHILIKEGEKSDFAYIVKKGELKIVSYQIPMVINQMQKGKKANQRTVINTNGYFSQTLNSFQIGIIEEKQWAGDEILVFKDDPFPFSIVAQSVVELLCIPKSELIHKMPKDIKDQLEDKATSKLDWVKRRLIDICLGAENVSRWDNLQEAFKEKVTEVSRRFPKANYKALINIISSTPDKKPNLNELMEMQNVNQKNQDSYNRHEEASENPLSQSQNLSALQQSQLNQSQLGNTPNLLSQKKLAHKFEKTIMLSPNDYAGKSCSGERPKTAMCQDSYFGGFFNTKVNFQKLFEDQAIRNSYQVFKPNQGSIILDTGKAQDNHDFQKNRTEFSQSQINLRPVTAICMSQVNLTNRLSTSQLPKRNFLNQVTPTGSHIFNMSTRTLPNQRYNNNLNPTLSQTQLTSTPQNLVNAPTLKNLTQVPLQIQNPSKVPMESASTFVCSYSQKYTVPTFSKLQLAKRQRYDMIIKHKVDKKKREECHQKVKSLKEAIIKKHDSFPLNDKTIKVKANIQSKQYNRTITPNFVNQWAKDNNIDLKKSSKNTVHQKSKVNSETATNQTIQKTLQRRSTIDLKRINSHSNLNLNAGALLMTTKQVK